MIINESFMLINSAFLFIILLFCFPVSAKPIQLQHAYNQLDIENNTVVNYNRSDFVQLVREQLYLSNKNMRMGFHRARCRNMERELAQVVLHFAEPLLHGLFPPLLKHQHGWLRARGPAISNCGAA